MTEQQGGWNNITILRRRAVRSGKRDINFLRGRRYWQSLIRCLGVAKSVQTAVLGSAHAVFQNNFPYILLLPARAVHTLKSGQHSNQFRG